MEIKINKAYSSFSTHKVFKFLMLISLLCLCKTVNGKSLLSKIKLVEKSKQNENLNDEGLLDLKPASKYYIHSLPGAPEDENPPIMHAGNINISDEGNSSIFFWHIDSKYTTDKSRTIIWLNGGPGCSSMDGMFLEVGPFRIRDDGKKLIYNNGSWHEYANLLFVDSPVGTGFSYTESNNLDHELSPMTTHFMAFLDKYFKIFPEHLNNDLYIAGESFAGQYIPYIGKAILNHNSQIKEGMINNTSQSVYNLKGLVIGNGIIDPQRQFPSTLQFAYKHGIIQRGTDEAKKVQQEHEKCLKALEKGPHVIMDECDAVLSTLLQVTAKESANKNEQCINMYDYTLRDSFPACGSSWPPDLTNVYKYFARPEVLEALNIDTEKKEGWTECDPNVHKAFTAYSSEPAINFFPELLEKIEIVLFAGDKDIICNYLGIEDTISELKWGGGTGFTDPKTGEYAVRQDWLFDFQNIGLWQSARNLTYVKFFNASHMVPWDYPLRTRYMMNSFMKVKSDRILQDKPISTVGKNKIGDFIPVYDLNILKGSLNSNLSNYNETHPEKTNSPDSKPSSNSSSSSMVIGKVIIVELLIACVVVVLYYFMFYKRYNNGLYGYQKITSSKYWPFTSYVSIKDVEEDYDDDRNNKNKNSFNSHIQFAPGSPQWKSTFSSNGRINSRGSIIDEETDFDEPFELDDLTPDTPYSQ